MMRIRPGGRADAEVLSALFTASVHTLAAPHYDAVQRRAWADPEPDLAHWRERLGELDVLVAERDGETAGFIGFTADGYIDLLFTAPAHARRGVARALFSLAEQRLRELGAPALRTHASRVSRPFFEQQGFVVVAVETVRLDDVGLERFEMRKAGAPA